MNSFLTTRVSRTKILMEKYTGYLIATSLIFMIPPCCDIHYNGYLCTSGDTHTDSIFLYCSDILSYCSIWVFLSFHKPDHIKASDVWTFFAFVWEMIAPNISQRVSRATIINYLQSISYKLIKYGRIQDINSSEFGYSVVTLLCIWIITLLLSIIIFKQKSIE